MLQHVDDVVDILTFLCPAAALFSSSHRADAPKKEAPSSKAPKLPSPTSEESTGGRASLVFQSLAEEMHAATACLRFSV